MDLFLHDWLGLYFCVINRGSNESRDNSAVRAVLLPNLRWVPAEPRWSLRA